MAGSSPRVWGTLALDFVEAVKIRFIPTGVGNIQHFSPMELIIAVHPHGCGEHKYEKSLVA